MRPARALHRPLRRGITAVSSADYTTNLPVVENPLSETGKWVLGLRDGGNWNNEQVTANGACGSKDDFGGTTRYADNLAHINPTFRCYLKKQWAQGTWYRQVGYNPSPGSHEMELLVFFSITPGVARGYECSIGMDSTGGTYAFIARWNGPYGDFTALIDPGGGIGSYTNAPTTPATGDVQYAEVTNTGVITLKQNGVVIVTATDTTWTYGSPGCGAWPVDGAVKDKACFSSFSCGQLP